MELGQQIKKHRKALSLSQDALAERIYVTRQTVSNWENDKSYPDVNSLLLLSEVFGVSIDILIKGDVEQMREEINKEEKQSFERLSRLLSVLFVLVLISPIPLLHFLHYAGIAIWAILTAVAMYTAFLVEREKKRFNIGTYKEIIAFTEGRSLSDIEKAREEGKRPYQKLLLGIASAIIALAVCALMAFLFKL